MTDKAKPTILDKVWNGLVRFAEHIEHAVVSAARALGLDEKGYHRICEIESGGRPNCVTGRYKGLFQLSDQEFRQHGGGNIMNPRDNSFAAARKLAAEAKLLERSTGRPARWCDVYLMHQQGIAGAANHLRYPNRPAWFNMWSTAEGQKKGKDWAKRAIWGNLKPADKKKFGKVENVSSAQFTAVWRRDSGDGLVFAHRDPSPKSPKPVPAPAIKTASAGEKTTKAGSAPPAPEIKTTPKKTITH